MLYDCIIVGGGPAGLNAALVLGRAKRQVLLFDDNKPRNAVTKHSHGFITRDGISPAGFRDIAHSEIGSYPSVHIRNERITRIRSSNKNFFEAYTGAGETFTARKIMLATGLKEILPDVNGIHHFYGRSLFNCAYCDGWELRDKPLVVIGENAHLFHLAKTVSNWSRDVVACSNGYRPLTSEQSSMLLRKGIRVIEHRIAALEGKDGRLKRIVFFNNEKLEREGGFVSPQWTQASSLGEELGCSLSARGGIQTDEFGRTTVQGVYASGDTSIIAPSQLIIAAAEGSRAAMGVNADLIQDEFEPEGYL
ncbi:NAD(P)/FAD-dependent oxidoreductase [Paenibacillus beijingensis]|uniref:Pyridine nucleotide-disulfide oxidoreductase n=1 Tax=Paenibacillus beijingensis TaxID=1126833 RepID=A0A0D5NN45_9BACL|nr:NAD(P)/FAD-dependent oxidoreductase [Paenibacillus beijingensis]AJY76719.1 pyridine nucleotide-disulfide oxidoreductase [Paenibacillus beijingensis]